MDLLAPDYRHSALIIIDFQNDCPRTSIYEASERDFRIVLAADAMSGLYEKGLLELKNIGVTVTETEDICRCLKNK